MKVVPLDDMVVTVIRPKSDQTKSGLYLPKSGNLLDQGSVIAEVVAVGPNVKSTEIKVGGYVMFHNSPQWLKHEDEETKTKYTVISERNIGAVVKD